MRCVEGHSMQVVQTECRLRFLASSNQYLDPVSREELSASKLCAGAIVLNGAERLQCTRLQSDSVSLKCRSAKPTQKGSLFLPTFWHMGFWSYSMLCQGEGEKEQAKETEPAQNHSRVHSEPERLIWFGQENFVNLPEVQRTMLVLCTAASPVTLKDIRYLICSYCICYTTNSTATDF